MNSPMTAGTAADAALPGPGDILNYVYLFAHEQDRGRDEGVKERPVLVLAVTGRTVLTLAITTRGETYPGTIALPEDVAKGAKLRHPSAVVVTEYNHFTWLGYDVRPVTDAASYVMGRLSPRFFAKIVNAVSANARAVNRN
jgi:hypothetical protein